MFSLPRRLLLDAALLPRGAALRLVLRRARHLGEAVLRERLGLQVEDLLLAVEAERARAGGLPLRLVGVDVDAGVLLGVVPAAREDLAARALRLALGHLLAARRAGADALLKEAGVLARLRHAELHLTALTPLLLLALHTEVHEASVALHLGRRLPLDPLGLLCGRLVLQHLDLGIVHLVAPPDDRDKAFPHLLAALHRPLAVDLNNLLVVRRGPRGLRREQVLVVDR